MHAFVKPGFKTSRIFVELLRPGYAAEIETEPGGSLFYYVGKINQILKTLFLLNCGYLIYLHDNAKINL
jgi:hypothetical protein